MKGYKITNIHPKKLSKFKVPCVLLHEGKPLSDDCPICRKYKVGFEKEEK